MRGMRGVVCVGGRQKRFRWSSIRTEYGWVVYPAEEGKGPYWQWERDSPMSHPSITRAQLTTRSYPYVSFWR